ncbi:hypothetical protein CU102_24425 [Phyllobacterium brassicacearum]|uniref:Uncharacterized protein n=1 Tax=Phyllobacterium brassicacearum TaxID=314235 RepID=A0A2P7B958_9HYPH|nr:hypothetical protein CU102_24425 [Phyllobacterium brassicacearum]TDQ13829.1 hypothetical protein DEV91_13922 [Phyllobacterium brassicacearum]
MIATEETQNVEMRCRGAESQLGPWPQLALATLVDLGMSNNKIAKYLRVDEGCVEWLRNEYRIRLD